MDVATQRESSITYEIDDELLFTINEELKNLVAEVDDLLRDITGETDSRFDQLDSCHKEELNSTTNQRDLSTSDTKSNQVYKAKVNKDTLCKGQDSLLIKCPEIWGNKKQGILRIDTIIDGSSQPAYYPNDQQTLLVNPNLEIILNSKECDLNVKVRVNDNNPPKQLNSDNKIVYTSVHYDINIKDQIKWVSNLRNSLGIGCANKSNQPDLTIKGIIIVEHWDLVSLNKFFPNFLEINSVDDVKLHVRLIKGQPPKNEDIVRYNVGYIDKVINCLSRYCSYIGISLYSAIFFGIADMLGYGNIQQINDWAQYMVIAGVIFFLLALLLSFSELTPIVIHRTTLRGRMSFNRSKTAKIIRTMGKRIKKYYNKYFKYSTNISSETEKVVDTSKQEGIDAKILNTPPEHKESKRSSRNSPQQPNTSKKGESTKFLSSNISAKTLQHSHVSKKTKNTGTLPTSSSSQNLLAASSFDQGNSGGNLSPKDLFDNLYRASTSKQGNDVETIDTEPHSFNMNKEPSHEHKELVPYVQQFENPSHEQYETKFKESRISSCSNFLSTSGIGNRPAEEIVATKKMTIFPGGVTQEEYSIRQKAFYNCMWCPIGVDLDNPLCLGYRSSSESVLRPNQKNPWCPGSNSSENSPGQYLNDSVFGPNGGIYSQSALRYNLDHSGNSGIQISPDVQSPNLHSPWYPLNRSSPQSVLNQSFDSSWYTGNGIFPRDVSRPNLDSVLKSSGSGLSFKSGSEPNLQNRIDEPMESSVVLHQPGQNPVSSVRTKFESMNI